MAALSARRQMQRQDGAGRFVPPTSKEARRSLPMPPILVEALRAHRGRQLEERLRLGPV